MNISIIGIGYTGLCTGVVFASLGHRVIGVDVDEKKIGMIRNGVSPIFETGLEELLSKTLAEKSFEVTTDMKYAIKNSEITFITVGTPSKDGKVDLRYVEKASIDLGQALKDKENHIIIMKSTVLPGTTEEITKKIVEKITGKKYAYAMNPEFLREGSALEDFLNSDSIIIGSNDRKTAAKLEGLYKQFKAPIIHTDIKTAEMVKYARNAYLAKDISFANEIANICEKFKIDYLVVKNAMRYDPRIGEKSFLDAGVGFGGSCFKKDLEALISASEEKGYEPRLLKETIDLNERQKLRIVELLEEHIGSVENKRIGILGLAFKPGTDDIREAPSIKIIQELLKKGAIITVYDPKAMDNIKEIFADKIEYSTIDGCLNTDACLILTQWVEFKGIDPEVKALIFDGRRALDPDKFRKIKKRYFGIGYPND